MHFVLRILRNFKVSICQFLSSFLEIQYFFRAVLTDLDFCFRVVRSLC